MPIDNQIEPPIPANPDGAARSASELCLAHSLNYTFGKTMANHLTYESFLDEVTTLITEKYDVTDAAAIQMVMRAQEDEFFSGHDDDPKICTLDRAHEDARTVFKKYK